MASRKGRPPISQTISASLDDFSAELARAGDGENLVDRIRRLTDHIDRLGIGEADRKLIEIGRGAKKNFAQAFSTAIAQKIANALRGSFPGIQPDQDGVGHESLSAGSRGLKKLDVNYSTSRSGLELAVSIKTINFRDDSTGRYTKNAKRVDGELRAEAQDCHGRQPFAVLAAFVFLPLDAAEDAKREVSSLKHVANILARRTGRTATTADNSIFEIAFIVLYAPDGSAVVLRADENIPERGVPSSALTFSEALAEVRRMHSDRNNR